MNKVCSVLFLMWLGLVSSIYTDNTVYAQDTYHVAYYSDFEPISYAESRDPLNPKFNNMRGYEYDLLKAIEKIPGSDIMFQFHGVKEWNNLWLKPAINPNIDIALGGITAEDSRTYHELQQVVDYTQKTVSFRQSLLVRAEDKPSIKTHEDLNCSDTVGAVRGTTGEYRFLVQAGYMNNLEEGMLEKGVSVILPNREFIQSDGKLRIYDERIVNRTKIVPTNGCNLPIVRYFLAEDSMIPALEEGHITAIARGYIGNCLVASKSDGRLSVTALYSLECDEEDTSNCMKPEYAAMYVKNERQDLKDLLNTYIDYLTDHGKIDFREWKKDHKVFKKRAIAFKADK